MYTSSKRSGETGSRMPLIRITLSWLKWRRILISRSVRLVSVRWTNALLIFLIATFSPLSLSFEHTTVPSRAVADRLHQRSAPARRSACRTIASSRPSCRRRRTDPKRPSSWRPPSWRQLNSRGQRTGSAAAAVKVLRSRGRACRWPSALHEAESPELAGGLSLPLAPRQQSRPAKVRALTRRACPRPTRSPRRRFRGCGRAHWSTGGVHSYSASKRGWPQGLDRCASRPGRKRRTSRCSWRRLSGSVAGITSAGQFRHGVPMLGEFTPPAWTAFSQGVGAERGSLTACPRLQVPAHQLCTFSAGARNS